MLAFRAPLAPIDIPFVPFAVRARRERAALEAKLEQQLMGPRVPPPSPVSAPTIADLEKTLREIMDLIHLKEAELTSVEAAFYVLGAF